MAKVQKFRLKQKDSSKDHQILLLNFTTHHKKGNNSRKESRNKGKQIEKSSEERKKKDLTAAKFLTKSHQGERERVGEEEEEVIETV